MLKKILLTCALLGPAIGFSDFGAASQWGVGVLEPEVGSQMVDLGAASQWGVGIPLGAVCFILFFVLTLLEKEVALYDAEQRQKSAKTTPSFAVESFAGGAWQTS